MEKIYELMREMDRLGAMAEEDGYRVSMMEVWTREDPATGTATRKVCDLVDYGEWRDEHMAAVSLRRLLSAMADSPWCGDCDGCMDCSCPVPGAKEEALRTLRSMQEG